MSILLAQFALSSVTNDHPTEKELSPKLPAKAASRIADSAPAAEAPAPAEVFSPKVSTAMRVDGQHRVCYQIINDHSGEVICEIPCEQIRKLEQESSAPPPRSEAAGRRIDVKS